MTKSIANIGGSVGGVTVTATGAVITGIPLEDTLERCMGEVGRAHRACNFIIGDLIIAAEERYGCKYARWAEITGMEIKSLTDIVSTCKRVPIDKRRLEGTLGYTHHKVVAALPPADQEKWLNLAEEKGLSRRRLKKSINLGRLATKRDMTPAKVAADDKGIDNVHPHVTRLVTYLAKKEREGELDEMDAEELYEFHRDLMPVLSRYGKVIGLLVELEKAQDPRVDFFTEALQVDLSGFGLTIQKDT